MKMHKFSKLACVLCAGLALAGEANASLVLFQSFTGPGVGKSTDGCGSMSQTCALTASVPVGATVRGVYLYSSAFAQPGGGAPSGTLQLNDGVTNPVTPYGGGAQVALGLAAGSLQAYRNDLTSFFTGPNAIVGNAAPLSFTVTENNATQDGEALVVVYEAGGPTSTAFIFDGASNPAGDSFGFNIAPFTGGVADMRLGIGFSFDGSAPASPSNTGQVSTIMVGPAVLTSVAGHCDDAKDVACLDGNLITVGGWNDPSSPANPTIDQDHERYNLGSLLNPGDTLVNVTTNNPSNDDNIFLAVFDFSGSATVTTVPEPTPLALMFIGGIACFGFSRRRRV